MKKFLLRCDASPKIGTGHLRRCLSLGKELKKFDSFIMLVCRKFEDINISFQDRVIDKLVEFDWNINTESEVREVIKICKNYQIDIAIIDTYRADLNYQQQLYQAGIRWLQFDWSAQQPLWADWVLSPSPAANKETYLSLTQRKETQLLIGPNYALIRDEFRQWQSKEKVSQQVERILLTFGGGDDKGATLFCLEALKSLTDNIELVVLVGSANPNLVEIKNFLKSNNNVKLCIDEKEVARRMTEADLALIAGGTTAYETAAMGLPSLILQIAENQKPNSQALEQQGVAINLGSIDELNPTDLLCHVVELAKDFQRRQKMSELGRKLIDGFGVQRVAQILLSAN